MERSPLAKLDGLTPEQRRMHIEWCLSIGLVEAATYHYRLLLPMDFPLGESEKLYKRIRAAKDAGWNYGTALFQDPPPELGLLPRSARNNGKM